MSNRKGDPAGAWEKQSQKGQGGPVMVWGVRDQGGGTHLRCNIQDNISLLNCTDTYFRLKWDYNQVQFSWTLQVSSHDLPDLNHKLKIKVSKSACEVVIWDYNVNYSLEGSDKISEAKRDTSIVV